MRLLFGRYFLSALAIAAMLLSTMPAIADGHESGSGAEEAVDFKTLERGVPYTEESIKRGRTIYMRYCTECHGSDGKAQIDIIADATDLTSPHLWYSGTTTGEVFRSIRDGAGVAMPPFKSQIRREEDIWHIVNFVQSLWPADLKPELETPEPGTEEEDSAESGGNEGE